MVRRSATPDFTITRLLVTAISVALRRTRPTPKKLAAITRLAAPTHRNTPANEACPLLTELHGVKSRLRPISARTAAMRACPDITIQWSRVSYWTVSPEMRCFSA